MVDSVLFVKLVMMSEKLLVKYVYDLIAEFSKFHFWYYFLCCCWQNNIKTVIINKHR